MYQKQALGKKYENRERENVISFCGMRLGEGGERECICNRERESKVCVCVCVCVCLQERKVHVCAFILWTVLVIWFACFETHLKVEIRNKS
jgi:hypothetical protein